MHTFKEYADLVKKEHALNKTIAPNETGTTASKAYAVGGHFIRNGILYKVTTAIASGATWSNISSSYTTEKDISSSIQNLSNQVNHNTNNGVKNLVISSKKAHSQSGIYYDPNDNGSYYVHGTNSSSSIAAAFVMNENFPVLLKANTTYILSGGVSAYLGLRLFADSTSYYYDASGNQVICNGTPVTFTNGNSDAYVYVRIRIAQSATVDGTVYPMIREAIIEDGTYQSGAESNSALTQKTTGLIDNQNVNGAKNRLNLNLSTIKAINNSGSWSGNVYTYRDVTFTLTVDGNNNITKIVVNGTASAHAAFFLASRQGSDNSDLIAMLKANSYVPSLGAEISTNVGISMDFYSSLSSYLSTWHSPDNKSAVTIPSNATIADVYFSVLSGNTANNVSVYPMISLENIYKVDPTFVPYAKTNKELTEDVTSIQGTLDERLKGSRSWNTTDTITWDIPTLNRIRVFYGGRGNGKAFMIILLPNSNEYLLFDPNNTIKTIEWNDDLSQKLKLSFNSTYGSTLGYLVI